MAGKVLNINIGVLGHVDSGKTSLVRVLSTLLSTAALDKAPESKTRGITLDLGFSAFIREIPEQLKRESGGYEQIQYTLVDCPGHASLIRTIIGGSQIIDRMLLVVDINKGIQTQTSECLIIGDILTEDLIVVLNKIDLVPLQERELKIAKVTEILRRALGATRFQNCPIIAVSSNVNEPLFIDDLINLIQSTARLPDRPDTDPDLFEMAIDHCFAIKGSGTILTGTLLRGSVSIGQTISIPEFKLERKVKSIQMFHRPVDSAFQGDRAALCVTNVDAKLIERTIICSPGSIPLANSIIASVRKVKYFGAVLKSGSKIHVTVGHATHVATVTLFGSNQLKQDALESLGKRLPKMIDFQERICKDEFEYDDILLGGGKAVGGPFLHLALIQFESPLLVLAPFGAALIGTKLDGGLDSHACRIAFYGRIVGSFDSTNTSSLILSENLRIYKRKVKEGYVDRIASKTSIIADGFFKKQTDLSPFLGLYCETSTGEKGIIESSFGKSGKLKIEFREGGEVPASLKTGDKLFLRFKKLVLSKTKTVFQ